MDLEPSETLGRSGRFRTSQPIMQIGSEGSFVFGGYDLNLTKHSRFRHLVLTNAINNIGVCELSLEYMSEWLLSVITDWSLDIELSQQNISSLGMEGMFALYRAIAHSADQQPPNYLMEIFS